VEKLKPTIVGFHDLAFRWRQFRDALENGNPERIKETTSIIAAIKDDHAIVSFYDKILNAGSFKPRVTHHDTKISNVLFNEKEQGICVIDLDTVMPGFFISDLGDMFRTYLSPANEEEKDLRLVEARKDYYQAIIEGYKEKMADQMSEDEIHHLNYAGEFMIYMQALRFFTDYLNNDSYYSISYPDTNLVRTMNQLKLLKSFRSIIS
jgi:Ser/Thr protein kinase RdoA (MazF antagonist)